MDLIEKKTVNINTAKEILAEMLVTGRAAHEIVESRGLTQVSDEEALMAVVNQVLDEHPDEVAQYVSGKDAISSWLMGQVMRATRGKANPQIARQILMTQLEARRNQ